jgi:anhydro-N-acetylmuramic acid kinase
MKLIGLMSGTSLDGVDVAWLESDGQDHLVPGPGRTIAYDPAFRDELRACFGQRTAPHAVIQELTLFHATAIHALLDDMGLGLDDVDAIGFHGQTLFHDPANRVTVQIGDGDFLADYLGKPVIYDFRSADVAAGGQGAPLVPVFHAALVRQALPKHDKPIALLNIGGVANLTIVAGADENLLAGDVGPGNALIDDWLLAHAGMQYDKDGMVAARGVVEAQRLAQWLGDSFFTQPLPKSLDRDHFSQCRVDDLSFIDGAATLTALTVGGIVTALRQLPMMIDQILVCGGGRHNKTIIKNLANQTNIPVRMVDELGWDGDVVEAQAFAYLAARVMAGLPISFPGTTGCPSPMQGGRIATPKNASISIQS